MQLNLRIERGDWGDGALANIETVARSVIDAFSPGLPSDLRFDIVLEQNAQPRALSRLGDRGEFVIHLSGPGSRWFRLCYQLGHEFTHVLADPLSWQIDRFAWFEEALADAGSLFALRSLAASWRDNPPRPGWHVNHASFQQYAINYLAEPGRSLPAGATLAQWFREHLPQLERSHTLREHNTIIARHLLSVFERDPSAWRSIRYLHSFPRSADMTFADFTRSWRNACPADSRGAVDAMTEMLGVSTGRPGATIRANAQKLLSALRLAVSSRKPSAPRDSTISAADRALAHEPPAHRPRPS